MIEIETLKFRQKCRECVYFPHFFPKFYPKIYHGFYPKFFPTLYHIVALTFSEILLHCIIIFIICPYIFRNSSRFYPKIPPKNLEDTPTFYNFTFYFFLEILLHFILNLNLFIWKFSNIYPKFASTLQKFPTFYPQFSPKFWLKVIRSCFGTSVFL